MAEWYADEETPDRGVWWWALEHAGHPCCYLRALMPGDFAPGRAVTPRHVLHLDGSRATEGCPVVCGTCGEVPLIDELEPIERATGQQGAIEAFRSRRAPWPRQTDIASCWECLAPPRMVTEVADVPGAGIVGLCSSCAALYPEEK